MKPEPTKTHPLINLLIVVAVAIALIAMVKINYQAERPSGLGQDYQYDVTSLATIDPNLITYEIAGPVLATGLSQAHGLDVDENGLIYVVGQGGLVVLDGQGDVTLKQSSDEPLRAIDVTSDGRIFVATANHVEVYDHEGQTLASWDPLGDKALITRILVTDSTVYVADAGRRQVLLYDHSGMLTGSISQDEEAHFEGFIVPSAYFDLALGRDGLLRVANPGRLRIDTFTQDGAYEFSWGEASNGIEGFCGCCNPAALAVLPDGGFITAEKGLMRVKHYSSDGGFLGVVAGPKELQVSMQPKVCKTPEDCQPDALDVAVDNTGRVYVLDTHQARVRIFVPKENQ